MYIGTGGWVEWDRRNWEVEREGSGGLGNERGDYGE
jgi:hypothetical protein